MHDIRVGSWPQALRGSLVSPGPRALGLGPLGLHKCFIFARRRGVFGTIELSCGFSDRVFHAQALRFRYKRFFVWPRPGTFWGFLGLLGLLGFPTIRILFCFYANEDCPQIGFMLMRIYMAMSTFILIFDAFYFSSRT